MLRIEKKTDENNTARRYRADSNKYINITRNVVKSQNLNE